jgi:hypoxanthine phosphoribosyltransferase
MSENVLEKLYTRDHIARQILRLGEEISRDYGNDEILLVGVLKGAFLFFADLVRAISSPTLVDFVRLASYGSHTQSSGIVELRKDLEFSVHGRHVVIVDDILDSGCTLEFLRQRLLDRQPLSLKTCVLLDKKQGRKVPVEADYVGISMESGFVVGYGLDYRENFRGLPDLYLLHDLRETRKGGPFGKSGN